MELKKTPWKSAVIIGIIILALICPTSALNKSPERTQSGQFDNQRLLEDVDVSGPGLPPANWNMINDASRYHISAEKTIDDVPALLWSYGCTATSAAMLFGYYDRNGYQNIYTGPTNSGIFPLTSVWGPQTIDPDDNSGECPLSASHNGVDGRSTRGHADDYYYEYNSTTDPYFGEWTEHSPDSLGDFMGTNQYHNWANTDGSTWLYYNSNNSPRYDPMPAGARDGAHGMKLFAESRGYSVETVYNQRPAGFNGLPAGFTFAQYKSEIDNNRPVIISVTGHSMLGVGYSDPDQIIFHNTWDPDIHSMTWMGSYQGMAHRGVTVFHLTPINGTPTVPTVTSITPNSNPNTTIGVTIAGTNFTSGALVLLTHSGYTNISATGVTVVSPTSITCTLPLSGTSEGLYDVVVKNPDGKEGVLSNGFRVGNGGSSIGIFRPSSGIWSLDSNGNFAWEGSDKSLSWGLPGDVPVIGDWNSDGKDDIGIFRPSSGIWSLDSNGNVAWEVSDISLSWGLPNDKPVIGDWNGDGKDDIGIFRPSSGIWSLDSNGNFTWEVSDKSLSWGLPGDVPVIGDWNGDGKDDIGIFRPSSGIWSLDSNGNVTWEVSDTSLSWGLPNDKPVIGDWNDDNKDDIGIFRPSSGIWSLDSNGNVTWEVSDTSLSWGLPNDEPVIGDWNNDNKDDIGIFRPSSGIWSLDSNGNVAWEVSDTSLSWGLPNDKPVVGKY